MRRISFPLTDASDFNSKTVARAGVISRSCTSSPNPHCATSVCVAQASRVRMIIPWMILRSSGGVFCFILEPPQIADGLQRLVRRLDRLAVELKTPLRLDQRHQFLHRIDVAAFQEILERGA